MADNDFQLKLLQMDLDIVKRELEIHKNNVELFKIRLDLDSIHHEDYEDYIKGLIDERDETKETRNNFIHISNLFYNKNTYLLKNEELSDEIKQLKEKKKELIRWQIMKD